MAMTWDHHATRSLNQLNQLPRVSRLFGTVSRLGDGIFWYVLMLGVALGHSLHGALVMAIAGASCTVLYKALKRLTARPRPCQIDAELHLTTAPLDHFSFPSGHTLHAVCFTIIAVQLLPWLGLVLSPFTILVALSRLVLGLHYPSDVLAGAAIGTGIASIAIAYL